MKKMTLFLINDFKESFSKSLQRLSKQLYLFNDDVEIFSQKF